MSRNLPNIGLIGDYSPGSGGWSTSMNQNLLRISVLTQGRILSVVSSLPVSPTEGDVHILDENHGTHPNELAVYDGGAWQYLGTPLQGWQLYNTATSSRVIFNGTVWIDDVVTADRMSSGAATVNQIPLADGSGGVVWGDAPLDNPLWLVTATGTGASQNITLPYSGLNPPEILVYSNGVKQFASDYSITGTTLTITSNAAGDAIEIVGGLISNTPPWLITDTGTGASQNITLPYSNLDENGVLVMVNGLRYATTEYSISGNTLTLTTNSSGDSIEILGVVL